MTNIIEVWTTNWFGVIGSITPAFKQYAMSLLLTQATLFNHAWNLDLPDPITTNHITAIYGMPKTNGISASLVLNGRYRWGIADERLENFMDLSFYSRTLVGHSEQCEKLAMMTNRLTTNLAVNLARDALTRISIPLTVLEKSEPIVSQFQYEDMTDYEHLPDAGELRPDALMQYEELSQQVEAAINALPPQRQKIYLMHRFDNRKYADIAEELQLSVRTVEVQIRKASQFLRETIAQNWGLLLILALSLVLPA